MTATEVKEADMRAAREASRTYLVAVERHFADADQLLREGKPDEAEAVARAAAILQMDVRYELTVRVGHGL